MINVPTMEISQAVKFDDILADVRKLSAYDKLVLIGILAEELRKDELLAPLKQKPTIEVWTPYDSYGVAQVLAQELENPLTEPLESPLPEGNAHAISILDSEFVTERN